MRCRLCGCEFDLTNMACHAECPLGSHCNLICCPNCGYQVVDESKSFVAKLLHRLWPSSSEEQRPEQPQQKITRQQSKRECVPLSHIPAGKPVKIHSFTDLPPSRLTQLIAFGLAPGTLVEILQRRPESIIRIGQTELALGEEILAKIWIQL